MLILPLFIIYFFILAIVTYFEYIRTSNPINLIFGIVLWTLLIPIFIYEIIH
jgi:hypothetical protein